MNHADLHEGSCCCCRREFLQAVGAAAGATALFAGGAVASPAKGSGAERQKTPAKIRGAFVYPPSETLRQEGYWSWPGSSFDAEGHQQQYMAKLRDMERNLGMEIAMAPKPLDDDASVDRFIKEVKQSPPDGLLLIPFKKGHWPKVVRIIEETKTPTVVLATLGVLLVDHINQLRRKPGVYLICAMDDLEAVRNGMKMIRAAHRLKESVLINLSGSDSKESLVPGLGTLVRNVPLQTFYAEFKRTTATDEVKQLARAYRDHAREIVEPSEGDILDAARAYYALKRLVEAEGADALMMNCLPGLRRPHQHVPPCMGFMSLRDEGVPAGCQSDLPATLTMMLVQQLFDKPGFQQNASMQTEGNYFFGAHCTSPSRMNGPSSPAEPIILRTHAEAGWGCVPQVLFPKGQKLTMALYHPGEKPQMHVYSGEVVRCYPKAPGGCRTNVEMTINEVEDACNVKGMHQIVFYGDYARQLRAFCQLYGIEVAV
jgi:hypothetical protein